MYYFKRNFRHFTLFFLIITLAIVLVGCNNEESTEEPTLNTKLTDKLTLDQDYEGKVYQTDRIGKATLVKCTDGDTADFLSGGETISVRFLDVDTPETKGKVDPWGPAASEFTCDKLTNAKTIVLEGRDKIKDTYDRYLGYIWYDGRLLNLELVELAYSKATAVSDDKYGDLFQEAETKARLTKKRIYGEKDPDYDYGRTKVTLEYLRTNIEDFYGKNIEFTGIVTRKLGPNPFIEADGFGVYIWMNYKTTSKFKVGNEVKIKGTVTMFDIGESYQINGVTKSTITEISKDNEVEPRVVTFDDITKDMEGSLLRVNDLTIINSEVSGDARNIYVKDQDNKEFMIRIDKAVSSKFEEVVFNKGAKIDIIAPLSSFKGEFQLMLCEVEDVIFK